MIDGIINSGKACRLVKKPKGGGSCLVNNTCFPWFFFPQLAIRSLDLLTKIKTLCFKISSVSCITGRTEIFIDYLSIELFVIYVA